MRTIETRSKVLSVSDSLTSFALWEGKPESFLSKHRVLLLRIALFFFIIASWQFFAGKPGEPWVLIDSYYVSTPRQVLVELGRWVATKELWPNLLATVHVTALGFVIGAVSAILLGFLVGMNKLLADVLNPFIAAFYSIPRLALMPLLLLWFGLGTASKVALVVLVCFLMIFNNTYSGVREVNPDLINIVNLMGASRFQVFRMVILPSAMVWVISGFRVSVPYALVGAVIAEMQSSNQGIGYLLVRSAGQFNVHGTFAAIIVIMILAMLLNFLIRLFEARALKWKASE